MLPPPLSPPPAARRAAGEMCLQASARLRFGTQAQFRPCAEARAQRHDYLALLSFSPVAVGLQHPHVLECREHQAPKVELVIYTHKNTHKHTHTHTHTSYLTRLGDVPRLAASKALTFSLPPIPPLPPSLPLLPGASASPSAPACRRVGDRDARAAPAHARAPPLPGALCLNQRPASIRWLRS
jgi:hypothetical protein